MATPQQHRCFLFSEDGKMLTILDAGKKTLILDYCYERFGIMETVLRIITGILVRKIEYTLALKKLKELLLKV